eukprot:1139847-Pelagomonas_calceolata.AAC.12
MARSSSSPGLDQHLQENNSSSQGGVPESAMPSCTAATVNTLPCQSDCTQNSFCLHASRVCLPCPPRVKKGKPRARCQPQVGASGNIDFCEDKKDSLTREF